MSQGLRGQVSFCHAVDPEVAAGPDGFGDDVASATKRLTGKGHDDAIRQADRRVARPDGS